MKKMFILSFAFLAASQAFAMGDGDPVVTFFSLDEFETRQQSGHDPLAWRGAIATGTDWHQLWFQSKGERVNGETEEHELQLYYSRAISPFWNVNVGWRGDIDPDPERHWLQLGVAGEAPFFIETEATLFVGNDGRSAFRLKTEKEMMLTQRWSLTPEVVADFHGHNDAETGTGSGLSTLEAGIRLGFQVTPQFSPYIGINWEKSFGNTADFARAEGEDVDSTQFVLGFRFWL